MIKLFGSGRRREEGSAELVLQHMRSIGLTVAAADPAPALEGPEEADLSSQGILEIRSGPISWLDVQTRNTGNHLGRLVYGVPAPDLRQVGTVHMWSVRVKSFPVIGWRVGVKWESFMRLPYSLQLMADDQELNGIMVRHLRQDVEVRSHPSQGHWSLQVGRWAPLHLPTSEEWEVYQALASALQKVR